MIREAYGSDLRNYPAVFIKILSSRVEPLGLGQGFVQDVELERKQVGIIFEIE